MPGLNMTTDAGVYTLTQWATTGTAGTATTIYTIGCGMTNTPCSTTTSPGWQPVVPADPKAVERAKRKAERLLKRHLDAQQRRELQQAGHFTVISADRQRRYRIVAGKAGARNVEEVDAEGKRIRRLCAHPADRRLPDADVLLAQKLMLEDLVAEREFLAIANVS